MTTVDRKIRAALVGTGYVSWYHARALQSLGFVDIVAACDPDSARGESFAKAFQTTAVTDFAALQAFHPDVIHVLTPPSSHCDLSVKALEMGSHVFVEKPMAQTAAECDRMMAAAAAAGRVLSVNHSARMDPVVLRALEAVRSGACGDVLAVDFLRSSDYPPYRGGALPPYYAEGAYPFQDLGVHALSLLEAFLGTIRDVNVQHVATGRNPSLTFDEWHGLVTCEKGTGRLYLSWNVATAQNELVIYGTRGVIHVDCYMQTCVVKPKRPMPKRIEQPYNAVLSSLSTIGAVVLNTARLATGRLRPSPGIHQSVREFYFALRENQPPPVPAEEGRRLTAWLERVSQKPNDEKRALAARARAPLAPATVLVTGASGFLGSALVARLARDGHTCRVMVRSASSAFQAMPNVAIVCGDLGNPDDVSHAVSGVDIVYHVGAAMKGQAADFECGTVWGTKNVIAAVLRHGVKRLVHVSSLSVLQHVGHRGDASINESSPVEAHPEWRGEYTKTKLVAEQLVNEAIRTQALPAVIVRPGMILGRRWPTAVPSGTFVVGRQWIVMGSGDLPLPLVYIDDVVDALILAAHGDNIVGSTIHVVDEHTVSQKDYIDRLQRFQPNPPRVRYVPGVLLLGLAAAMAVLARLLGRKGVTTYQMRSLQPLSRFDASTAKRLLQWSPRVGVAEGLKRTFPEAASVDGPVPLSSTVGVTWRSS
jgi:predicted dehydrogenase/nucleoside-diphosphate-sugar epimerase